MKTKRQELIKPEIERIYIGWKEDYNPELVTRLMLEKYTGFVIYERYSNGNIKEEYEWKEGRAYGYQIEYYENGQVKSYEQMDDSLPIGSSMEYWEDGSIKDEDIEIDGKGVHRQYDREGNLTYEFYDGKIKGTLRKVDYNF